MAYVPDNHGHAAHAEHAHPNYRGIFVLLCVCTGISWLLDELEGLSIPLPALVLVGAVLAVALVKAGAVMSYFMHLKFEGSWKFIILMPTAILAVGLMVALAPDMALHYYTNDVPQTRASASETGHGGPAEEHADGSGPPAAGGGHGAPQQPRAGGH